MLTDMKRRLFLKSSAITTAILSTGLLVPQMLMAKWNEQAFESKTVADALKALLGSGDAEESTQINIKAPEVAENGAVVPITVSTDLTDVKSITILADKNPSPLAASFDLGEGATPTVKTRIKMGKTGNVVAIVTTGDKRYQAQKEVKVTIGGCGG